MITLTKEDIAAMRHASRYFVALNKHGKAGAVLHLIKELKAEKEIAGFTDGDLRREVRREINANTHTKVTAGFYASYREGAWQALTLIVRPGDSLVFDARQNGNGYLEAAEIPAGKMNDTYHRGGYARLYFDELLVSVVRPGANGRPKTVIRELVLQSSICPNNSARAIQETEYALATA